MSRTRLYNSYIPYNRPKLPRNQYGLIDVTSLNSTNSTLFGSNESSSSVGGQMVQLNDFTGATEIEDGIRGLVPAPVQGQQDWFLQGSGGWKYIPAFKWMSEFPEAKGLDKSGLQVNGDLNVTDTLTTMNLEVQGAAHFWSLIIDEVKSTGGQVLVSPSQFTVDWIGDIQYLGVFEPNKDYTLLLQSRPDIYNALYINDITDFKCRRLYQRNDDSSKKIFNECVVGDMLRCRQFNIQEGTYTNVKNDDWWSFVAQAGTEDYTDEDGNTYPAFYVDIVYALRKSDGTTVPLSSVLSTTEPSITYPDYWTGDIIANELKKVSQQTLDGTQNVSPELFDTEEWNDITNNVIKIRGFDDSINQIVGFESSGEINSSNINQTNNILNTIANGTSSSDVNSNYDEGDYSNLILNGTLSSEPVTINNLDEANSLADSIISEDILIQNSYNLIQEKQTFKPFYLEKNYVTEEDLYAAEDIIINISGTDVTKHKGEIIPSGSTIKYGVGNTLEDGGFVSLGNDSIVYKKYDNEQTPEEAVDVTGDELEEIKTTTKETSFGTDRDVFKHNINDYDQRREWKFGHGQFTVKIGAQLACLGHLFNPDRQNAIVISATNPIDPDLEAPALAQYNQIDTFGESINKYRMTAIAANGNEFIGSFLVNYNETYLDINERINMFITDIKTGLETVGIHLDGEKSTITLVGNIDIKQHSSTSWDTLNLYDNNDNKRLEISPFEIPKRESSDFGSITKKSFYLPGDVSSTTIPKGYVTQRNWKDWDGPFYYHWVYSWEMSDYQLSVSATMNLGKYNTGYELDIDKLDLNLWYPSYVAGDRYVDTYRTSNIKVYYTLKCGGTNIGKTNVDITGLFTITPTDGASNDIYLKTTGKILDDWSIPKEGNYTLTIKVLFNTYMYTRKNNSGYNNYYITSNIYLLGSGQLIYSPVQSTSNSDTSLRMTRIGTNGLSFIGNNSRYFYAATDGVEMKWDNVSMGVDSYVGLKTNNRVYTTSYIINNNRGIVYPDTDIVITSNPTTSQSITLYNGSLDLGKGKEVTVIDCSYVTINNCSHIKQQYVTWEESDGESDRTIVHSVINSVRKFIWYNSEWYEV